MAVFRVEKTKNYTVMANYHLREKKMSLKAKGLLSWMLSNTDDWDYSLQGIASNCKENITAIRTALKELQKFGYLEIKKLMPESYETADGDKVVIRSKIDYEYIIHEQPVDIDIENQGIENIYIDSVSIENNIQRNTIKRNTKKENTKERNTKKINSPTASISSPDTFLNSGKQPKQLNLYQSCLAMINDFTDDQQVRYKAKIFLDSLLEMGKLRGRNQFSGIIKKLVQYADGDMKKAVRILDYSIEHGYPTIYDENTNYTRKTGSVVTDIEHLPEVDDDYTDEERRKIKEEMASGKYPVY